MKKILLTLIFFILLAVLAEAAVFSDVPETEWYAKDVAAVSNVGLMGGVDYDEFSPNSGISLAEVVTIAARARASYAGDTIENGVWAWYEPYVAYAASCGLLPDGGYADYEAYAARKDIALLLAAALPDEYFAPINDVADIPDVPATRSYADAVLKLYRAGLVGGNDAYGHFYPERGLTRAETAAILHRLINESARLHTSLIPVSTEEAYLLEHTRSFLYTTYDFQTSGWTQDIRGGLPEKSTDIESGELRDVSRTEGTALIRHYNKITTGRLVTDAYVNFIGNLEGAYFEFQNDCGGSVFRMQAVGGAWRALNGDGSYTRMTRADLGRYNLRFIIDLERAKAEVLFNFESVGVFPLLASGDDLNILNFRMATTEASTASLSINNLDSYVNFAAYETFTFGGETPALWTGNEGLKRTDAMLTLDKDGEGFYAMPITSGKIIAETEFLPETGNRAVYALTFEGETVLRFAADGTHMNVNGENVYDYTNGVWYRLRFELDTDNLTVLVKVNGREIAAVPFLIKTAAVDGISVYNTGDEIVFFDNFKVWRHFEHDDYVPAPVRPAGEENYLIGVEDMPAWQEGNHRGWKLIAGVDKPILGYYDEGNPEVADWEIKYMVEHGIDFRDFCWFPHLVDGKIKPTEASEFHSLHDGFMNAKYSHEMSYCILWEATNSSRPTDIGQFNTVFLPYIVENYFKDDRNLVIDNKLVFTFYGPRAFGDPTLVKQMIVSMDDAAKALGYDGVLVFACQCSKAEAVSMGIDATYNYGFSREGSWRADYQILRNTAAALQTVEGGAPYYIPSADTSQNTPAWFGTLRPFLDKEGYKRVLTFIRDDYLPTYAREDWQRNLLFLATWNEHGEGNSVMPLERNREFEYLDALREVFTDETENASVDVAPTQAQTARFTHMYPQYLRPLRAQGYNDLAAYERTPEYFVHRRIDFADAKATTGGNYSNLSFGSDGMSGVSTSNDCYLFIAPFFSICLDDIDALAFTAKVPLGEEMQIFYKLDGQANWSGSQVISIYAEHDDMYEYVVKLDKSKWKGMLTGIRIDPTTMPDEAFTVQSLEFLSETPPSAYPALQTLWMKDMTASYGMGVTDYRNTDAGISGVASGNDPIVFVSGFSPIDLTGVKIVEITAAVPKGNKIEMFTTKSADGGWTYDRRAAVVSASDDMTTYFIPVSQTEWSGTLTDMRLDVGDTPGKPFAVRSVRFLAEAPKADEGLPLFINGDDTGLKSQGFDADGGALFAYDPRAALEKRMTSYLTWSREEKRMTVSANGHTAVFTIGSAAYVVDGRTRTLPQAVGEDDGLPVLPMRALAEALGFDCSQTDDGVFIETQWSEYTAALVEAQAAVDDFEFDVPDALVGFNSYNVGLTVTEDGYLHGECQSRDPVVLKTLVKPLSTAEYNYIDVRMRYAFTPEDPSDVKDRVQIFFSTDKSGGWSEPKSCSVPLTKADSDGEFVEFHFDMSTRPQWKDNITAIRFDPFNAFPGSFDVDCIRFGYDPTKTQAVEEEKMYDNASLFASGDDEGMLIFGYTFGAYGDRTSYWGCLEPDYLNKNTSYKLYTQDSYESGTTIRNGNLVSRGITGGALWFTGASAQAKPCILFSPLEPEKSDWAKKATYTLEYDFTGSGTYAEIVCAGIGGAFKTGTVSGKTDGMTHAALTFSIDGKKRTAVRYIYIYSAVGDERFVIDNITLRVGEYVGGEDGADETIEPEKKTVFGDSEEYGRLILAYGFDEYGDVKGTLPPLFPDYQADEERYPLYGDERFDNFTTLRTNNYSARRIEDHAVVLESVIIASVPSLLISPNHPSEPTRSDWSKQGVYTLLFDFKGDSACVQFRYGEDGAKNSLPVIGSPDEWKTVIASITVDGSDAPYLKYLYLNSASGKTTIAFDNIRLYFREA